MLLTLLVALVFCFMINVPIGFAMGIAVFASLIASGAMPIAMLPQRMVAGMNSFPLLAIPLFMLAGTIMERGGISKRIVGLASALLGHVQGGLAAVSVLACTFFASISGSAPGTAAAVGELTIPEMVKRGYSNAYASAVVASASCLGVVVPPSITFIIFGIVADVSIGQLFIAGIVPGALLSLALIVVSVLRSRQLGYPTEERQNWSKRWRTFVDSLWGLMLPAIILGGIMTGIFTPTESAGIAVFYGLFVSIFIYRELGWKDLIPVFYKASLNSAMIVLLIAMASPFGWIMIVEQVPQMASSALLGFSTNVYVILMLMIIMYLVLGTFMETGAIILLIVPIFAPVAQQLGIDMVHFGVITVVALAIGMATPPVGITLFATCGISGVSIGQLSRMIVPFLLALIACLVLLAYVPFISTFLPSLVF
ncbi:TRAP transporter large permease [Halomonas sp. MCCC 1A11036]|uniref:TRAP transporter large permease protein n=1 Tax=Billgrantia zhangzhouensis TaxID=2733481 RepID=A0ABS9AA66_9GAMM|nr:TRAP transporter large permease [Halomonas zhangzhouensis]MCE8018759.1 TRAP transporter large permease [Halomonas zhangzhouensis]